MLTDLKIKNLPPPESRREIADGKIPGLYLIQQTSGAMSWALRYRFDGTPKKYTIGPCPPILLAAARRRAQEALGDIAGGKDPAAAKQASRAAAKAEREADVDRVERVIELFIERHAKPKTRDWRETERMLVNEVITRWKGRRLSAITRAHVHDMLDEIIDRGAPVRANRVFATFRKMCQLGGRAQDRRAPAPARAWRAPSRRDAPRARSPATRRSGSCGAPSTSLAGRSAQ